MLLTELKQEIQNDPANLGYGGAVSAGQDGVVADLLNAKNFDGNQLVPISTLESYVDAQGLRDGIEGSIAENPAARAVSRLFQARYETIDLTLPAVTAALQGLKQSSLITDQNLQDVMNMGKLRISRAEVLWGIGSYVTHEQVGYSLRSQ